MNDKVIAALGKKGAVINIARGSVVDEPALVKALVEGNLRGAGSTYSPTSCQRARGSDEAR